jgi:hypothetical protein
MDDRSRYRKRVSPSYFRCRLRNMKKMHKFLFVLASAGLFVASAQAQNAGTVTANAFAIGKGAGTTGYASLLCASAQLAVGQSAAAPLCKTVTGDVTLSAAGAATLATVNSNVGSFGSATASPTFTVNAKGLITAASSNTITPAIGSITGLGTGCATFLATPSSANLRGCLTDEVGTGAAYFVGGALGTPASATLTNATGLPLSGLTTQGAFTFVGNNTSGSAVPTAVDIAALTTKASPAAGDYMMISDQAASGAWKKATVSSVASAGSVASLNGNTGSLNVRVIIQTFTATGTYTPTSGMVYAQIECWGGGGGGGGTASASASTGSGGAGGGAGSPSLKISTAAAVGASQVVTIGAAGTAGASGNNAGGAGGDTSVGTLCIGKGGSGGGGSAGSGSVTVGAGGVAGTGDVTGTGMPGGGFPAINGAQGYGGNGGSATPVGAGGAAIMTATTATGNVGTGRASGGGGGASFNGNGAAAGAAGTAGYVKVTEYVIN